jgi:hypothetical protein
LSVAKKSSWSRCPGCRNIVEKKVISPTCLFQKDDQTELKLYCRVAALKFIAYVESICKRRNYHDIIISISNPSSPFIFIAATTVVFEFMLLHIIAVIVGVSEDWKIVEMKCSNIKSKMLEVAVLGFLNKYLLHCFSLLLSFIAHISNRSLSINK